MFVRKVSTKSVCQGSYKVLKLLEILEFDLSPGKPLKTAIFLRRYLKST